MISAARVGTRRWPPTVLTHVVAVPDSLSSALLRRCLGRVTYLQAVHEAQAVGMAVGLALGGAIPLICMENSGLRAACESVARLVVLHDVKVAFLLSWRGTVEDANWWSANHEHDTEALLEMFGFRRSVPRRFYDLPGAVSAAAGLAHRRIASVAVLATPSVLAEVT